MDKDIFIFLLAILIITNNIRWWLNNKGYPYQKYILLAGICWIITLTAGWAGMKFDILPLMIITIFAVFGFFSFCIKAIIAERKFKNKTSHD